MLRLLLCRAQVVLFLLPELRDALMQADILDLVFEECIEELRAAREVGSTNYKDAIAGLRLGVGVHGLAQMPMPAPLDDAGLVVRPVKAEIAVKGTRLCNAELELAGEHCAVVVVNEA